MNYKINPVKATCQNLGYGEGLQTINDKCFGICAAFSQTYDTYEMDPNCVTACEKLVEEKRVDLYGVGSCDHQAPYRSVFWGQVPRYMPKLLKKGLDLETAKKVCYSQCSKLSTLSNECQSMCKLDSDAVEVVKTPPPPAPIPPQPSPVQTTISENKEKDPNLIVLSVILGIISILTILTLVKK